jgi:hypothetical protein
MPMQAGNFSKFSGRGSAMWTNPNKLLKQEDVVESQKPQIGLKRVKLQVPKPYQKKTIESSIQVEEPLKTL